MWAEANERRIHFQTQSSILGSFHVLRSLSPHKRCSGIHAKSANDFSVLGELLRGVQNMERHLRLSAKAASNFLITADRLVSPSSQHPWDWQLRPNKDIWLVQKVLRCVSACWPCPQASLFRSADELVNPKPRLQALTTKGTIDLKWFMKRRYETHNITGPWLQKKRRPKTVDSPGWILTVSSKKEWLKMSMAKLCFKGAVGSAPAEVLGTLCQHLSWMSEILGCRTPKKSPTSPRAPSVITHLAAPAQWLEAIVPQKSKNNWR